MPKEYLFYFIPKITLNLLNKKKKHLQNPLGLKNDSQSTQNPNIYILHGSSHFSISIEPFLPKKVG
jgi:hypothetical protein